MGDTFKSYKQESRKDWGCTTHEGTPLDREELMLGSILRIADATELMAKNYQHLIEERDRYKRWYENEEKRSSKLRKQISAYKGVVTKLKTITPPPKK